MSPGHELDRFIAEKVMGMTVYHYDKDREDNCYFMLMDHTFDSVVLNIRGAAERKTEAEAWADVPKYSESIAHAWVVVERMASKGRTLDALWQGKQSPWFVRFSECWVASAGDTAPHAICLAACNAIGAAIPPNVQSTGRAGNVIDGKADIGMGGEK